MVQKFHSRKTFSSKEHTENSLRELHVLADAQNSDLQARAERAADCRAGGGPAILSGKTITLQDLT